jgi:hypothetical protein
LSPTFGATHGALGSNGGDPLNQAIPTKDVSTRRRCGGMGTFRTTNSTGISRLGWMYFSAMIVLLKHSEIPCSIFVGCRIRMMVYDACSSFGQPVCHVSSDEGGGLNPNHKSSNMHGIGTMFDPIFCVFMA